MTDKPNPTQAILIAFMLLLLPASALADTITIEPCESDASCSAIQAAIDSAADGDVIEVKSGMYPENVLVNKPLVLKGVDSGGGRPVVDAGGSGSAITLSAEGIRLEGFEVTGAGREIMNAGILVRSNENVISGNLVHDNGFYGIFINASRNSSIVENEISWNTIGIAFCSSNDSIMANNTLSKNEGGIELRKSYNTTINSGNNISINDYGILYDSESIIATIIDDPLMEGNGQDRFPINEVITNGIPTCLPPDEVVILEGAAIVEELDDEVVEM